MMVYGDLLIIYPKPYSIYLRGAIVLEHMVVSRHGGSPI